MKNKSLYQQCNTEISEQEKMKQGLWYDANNDADLLQQRELAEERCFCFNSTLPRDLKRKEEILKELLPNCGSEVTILAPFYTDYGYNCLIGDHSFINHNAYFMDGAPIHIGAWCFVGPNCGVYTAAHPLLAVERNKGLEKASPVTIGNNVWIGADVTILSGVTIGDGTVIGAKSVVTKDIPANVIAAGNPCRILRKITEQDSIQKDGEVK